MAEEDRVAVAFGEVIREHRTRMGLSQERLSFVCDRHRTYVSMIERGRNSPSLLTIWRLAKALDTRPSTLIRQVERRVDL